MAHMVLGRLSRRNRTRSGDNKAERPPSIIVRSLFNSKMKGSGSFGAASSQYELWEKIKWTREGELERGHERK